MRLGTALLTYAQKSPRTRDRGVPPHAMFLRGWLPLPYMDYEKTLGLGPNKTQILVHPWIGLLNPSSDTPSLLVSAFLHDEDQHPIETHLEYAQQLPSFQSCRWLGRTSFWGAWWPGHSWKLDRRPESSRIYTYSHLPKRILRAGEELYGSTSPILDALQQPRRVIRELHIPGPSKFFIQLVYPLFQ